jgi:hypothetical protein
MLLARLSTITAVACLLALTASEIGAVELVPSALERERQQLRFPSTLSQTGLPGWAAATNQSEDDFDSVRPGQKSPLKAFLLSAVIPGAGQFYNGSRIKPFVFLGIEIAAWGFHFKWQGQADDATGAYEAFNRAHWSRYDYEQRYLLWAYGVTDDDSIIATEVSHHLPDTETQQYFEMTGKYDQFAWGWDDAVRDGRTLDDFENDPTVRIDGEPTTPYSANRLTYEGMRHDANSKYDKARKMIIVSIVNRLASGFEAYIAAKRHNDQAGEADDLLSRVSVKASLKSYYTSQDTPFLRLSYKF